MKELVHLLSTIEEGQDIEELCKRLLSKMSAPSTWTPDSNLGMVIILSASSSLGTRLLTTEQWTSFNSLVSTAKSKYQQMVALPDEQMALLENLVHKNAK